MAAWDAGRVSVGITATSITAVPAAACTAVIRNDGNYPLWVSNSSGITATNGYLIKPGEAFTFTTSAAATVYGVSNNTVQVYWVRSA